VTLSYTLVSRHDHIGYFVFSAITSRPVSLLKISKASVLFTIVCTFPPISIDQQLMCPYQINSLLVCLKRLMAYSRAVFLNRRAAAWYRALASIIPGLERFSWNLSF